MMHTLVLPRVEVARFPPKNIAETDEHLFSHEYRKIVQAWEADFLGNVDVLPNGILVRRFRVLSQSFTTGKVSLRQYLRAGRTIASTIFRSSRPNEGNALFATDEFSNGFFHWICDVLPRLEALALLDPEQLKSRTVVVPAMADFPYARDTLSAYETGGVRFMKAGEAAHCSDLLVMPPVAPTGNYRPDIMQAIRRRFTSRVVASGNEERMYISRIHAPRRKVLNEEALQPVLTRFGFNPVVAEELPFHEQVRRIGAASVLVGNHGAGLTHMLWMKPGAAVVELRRRGDRQNNCYFSLASALDLKYFYVLCDAGNPRENAHQGDIIVDPHRLQDVLAVACDARGP